MRIGITSLTLQETLRPCGQAGTHSRSAQCLLPPPSAPTQLRGRPPEHAVAPSTPLGPYPWPGDPAPLLQRSCALPTCAPEGAPEADDGPCSTGGHLLGPAVVRPADFDTTSASPEQSLTLRETTPPGMGRTPQEARSTDEERVGGQDQGDSPCAPRPGGLGHRSQGLAELSPGNEGTRPSPGAGGRRGG